MLSGDQKLDPRNVCVIFSEGPIVLNSAVSVNFDNTRQYYYARDNLF
jgi:hypothetical protein